MLCMGETVCARVVSGPVRRQWGALMVCRLAETLEGRGLGWVEGYVVITQRLHARPGLHYICRIPHMPCQARQPQETEALLARFSSSALLYVQRSPG